MEQKSLKDIIWERMDAKSLNLEKIFQNTGIPKHYLEMILAGEWHKLPAAPYAKGYFKKLELVLELDQDFLWNFYKEEVEVKASGAEDRLPENRYAIKTTSRKWLWPVLAVTAIAIYLGINAGHLIGRPILNITSPLQATVVTSFSNFDFVGEIDPKDKLFINQEEIYVDKSGRFQENYNLQPGLNTFEITAKKFLGKETKVVKQIIYQLSENNDKQGTR